MKPQGIQLTMPRHNFISFTHSWPICVLAPCNSTFNLLQGYFHQCQVYFESLLEHKPEEPEVVRFMLLKLTGPAYLLAKYPVTFENPCLRSLTDIGYMLASLFLSLRRDTTQNLGG